LQLAAIEPGDIVQCDVRGRIFYGLVVEKGNRELKLRPITANISYYTVTANEVKEHWRKGGRRRKAVDNS